MQRQNEINSRNLYIKNLNEYLSAASSFLADTLQNLNWTEGATVFKSSDKPLVICPLDPCHRLTKNKLDKHLEMCRWHRLGYKDDDVSFPPTSANIPCTAVAIDKSLQRDIILKAAQRDPTLKIGENVLDREVPQTSERFFSDFTTDERRVIYDYVVSKTAGVMPQLKEFNLFMKPEGQSAAMTREQLMAAERDAKRRRVKHRSAKVHTKSKNYSEVLRDVINNQMMAYEDWIKENFGNDNLTESVQPEMKKDVACNQEKPNMVWLDWDFRSNTHTQWKYILEKEKRRKESGEKNEYGHRETSNRVGETNHKDRKNKTGESSSERLYLKEDRRKRGTSCESRRNNYCQDSKALYHHGGRMKECSRKESYHPRYREHSNDAKNYKRDRYNKEHKSERRDKTESKNDDSKRKFSDKNFTKNNPTEIWPIKKSKYQKDEKNFPNSRKKNKYDSDELEQAFQVQEERMEDSQKESCSHHGKSSEAVPLKREHSVQSSESSSGHSQSDFSSDDSRVKRRKKSKKQHKHKHKKKHRK